MIDFNWKEISDYLYSLSGKVAPQLKGGDIKTLLQYKTECEYVVKNKSLYKISVDTAKYMIVKIDKLLKQVKPKRETSNLFEVEK